MRHNKYLFLFILCGWLAACVKEPATVPSNAGADRLLTDILQNNYQFSMFYDALKRTGLDNTLEGEGPFTVLVPDNNAFAASGITTDSLAKINTDTLAKLLRYHIIGANIPYLSVPQTIDFPYQTLAGEPVYFSKPIPSATQFQSLTANIVHVNGRTVVKTDMLARNGVIHVLDKALYYPGTTIQDVLTANPRYSRFVYALKSFGMWDELGKPGNFTVSAPDNDLFDQIGLDESQLDTLHYKKMLISPYVLADHRFFVTDLEDAPTPRGYMGLLLPDYVLHIDSYSATYGVYSYDYAKIIALPQDPYWGNPLVYGPSANFVNSDHQAGNGIVHGLDQIIMMPDSAILHP